MTLLSIRFFCGNSARLIAATAIIFTVLAGATKINAATYDNSSSAAAAPTNPFEAFRRMLQPAPSPAEQASALQVVQESAAPQKRSRKRGRKARTRTKTEERVEKADNAGEQTAPVSQPLTPFVQVWPHVETGANENTQRVVSENADGIAPVGVKSNRLVSDALDTAQSGLTFVDADEENDLDRAAHSSAQPVMLASTDGAAPSDIGEQVASHNRFYAFAEAVKAIPKAPWFESVMLVLAGVIAAFLAARIFVRAQ